MHLAGFVLVGGRSSRMGRDKARLPATSGLLVQEIAAKIHTVTGNVSLIGKAHRYCDLPFECFDDLRPFVGPLAGIETALATGQGDWNLIVACDMPNVRKEWLVALVEQAAQGGSDCVVLKDANAKVHPLCGVWKSTCLPSVCRALDSRRLAVMDLLPELATAYISVAGSIENVNTPDEWERWQAYTAQETVNAG